MTRLAVARIVLSLSFCLSFAESLSAQGLPDRDVSQIWIRGLKTISAGTIHRQLACLPEIVEVSHSSVDSTTYTARVRDAVARGMLASGFFDSRVELTEEAGLRIMEIQEGDRFHCGSITVEGVSDDVEAWIRSQLQIASTETEDAKPVWRPGEPADGTPIGQLGWRRDIRKRLTEIGVQGDAALVDLARNEAGKTLDLHLELASNDASFVVPVQGDSNDIVPAPNRHDSDNPTPPQSIGGELQQIHRRLFSSPMSGVRIRGIDDICTIELVIGSAAAIAKIEYESHRRTVVIDRGEVLICMEDPTAAIRVPLPDASATLYIESSEESAGRMMRLSLTGAFATDKVERSVRAGVMLTEQAWTEWFPPDSTERSEDERGVTYSNAGHTLRLDHQGELVELSGPDSSGRPILLNRIEEDEIRKLVDEIVQACDPVELFVRDPDTGRQVSLARTLHKILNRNPNDVGFHIPPAGGESDVYAVLVLMLVHDGAFGEPDSLPARLANLCALEMSGNRRGLRERLAEIEPDLLEGPISSAVVATLCAWHGSSEQALNQFRHAQQLVGGTDAVLHDLGLLLDSNNLLGRLCQQVDVKRWIQQSTLLAEPFFEEPQVVQSIRILTDSFPDADTNQERCDNAKLLLALVYEIAVQEPLEEYVAEMIQHLESRQEAIAEGQASDETKR